MISAAAWAFTWWRKGKRNHCSKYHSNCCSSSSEKGSWMEMGYSASCSKLKSALEPSCPLGCSRMRISVMPLPLFVSLREVILLLVDREHQDVAAVRLIDLPDLGLCVRSFWSAHARCEQSGH